MPALKPWLLAVIFLVPAAVIAAAWRLRRPPSGQEGTVQIRPGFLHFLGEQDGPREKTLKSALAAFFQGDGGVRRAYLARLETEEGRIVGLCLKMDPLPDESYPDRIGEIFVRLMGPGGCLHVLFLTDDQEAALLRVCRPFYEPRK